MHSNFPMDRAAGGHPTHEQPQLLMEEVHLQDYLEVIYRRRKLILAVFAAVFAGVAMYTFTMKPVYEAVTTLHVEDQKGNAQALDLLAFGKANPVEAELEILKSRTNAEKVVRQLHLDWKVSQKPSGMTFRILEFTSTSDKPRYSVELNGNGGFTVRNMHGEIVGQGLPGLRMAGRGLTLLLYDLRGAKGDSFRLELLPFNATVEAVRTNMRAAEVGKKSNIISLSYRDTDRFLARDVVNGLAQAYLEQSVGFKAEEASRTVDFVQEQLQGLRNELDQAEKNLESYKSASGVMQLDSTAEQLILKLSATEKELTGITIQKKGTEFALDALKQARGRGVTYSPAVTRDDPVVAGMATHLAELELQKRALGVDSTENHPEMKSLKEQINEIQRKIQATYESTLKSLGKQEQDVRAQLGRYEDTLKSLPAAERDLVKLTRVSKVNADIYTFLLQKQEEARIAKASTISNIKVVDSAIAPDKPVMPQKKKNLLLGLLIGAMLGVGMAFFREYLDNTIKDKEGAKRELKWPVLTVIPRMQESDRQRERTPLLSHLDPKSTVAESLRCLRTGIHLSSVRRKHQVIMMTSSFPGEGKSTITSNLSCILAQTGARVVLVDCDLRRSTLHEKLGLTREPGLTNCLAGDAPLAKVVRKTSIPNLDFISAGTIPPNPAELLGSDKMKEVFHSLRNNYDKVLIDAPPVLPVTDAQLLASLSDMVLVVVELGRVPLKAARQMREALTCVNAPVAGLILNDKTGKGENYGYYGYYGYGYYSQEEVDLPKLSGKEWRAS